MAKNIGLIKFEGSLGDVVGYPRNGKYVLQRKGGFNGERTRTEERYEGTRQRQSEFGRCATLASVFKRVFQSYLDFVPDSYVYSWIQSKLLEVKACDVASAKGDKTVGKGLMTEQGKLLMEKMHFNRAASLRTVLHVPFQVDLVEGRFSIAGFSVAAGLSFPKGAAVCCMQFMVLRFDLEAVSYVLEASDLVVLHRESSVKSDLVLEVDLPEGAGFLFGFLSLTYGVMDRKNVQLLRNKRTVLDVIGVVL